MRVKLYRDLHTLHQDSPLAVDVRLEPSGELNLKLVQKEWNLQNCFVSYFGRDALCCKLTCDIGRRLLPTTDISARTS